MKHRRQTLLKHRSKKSLKSEPRLGGSGGTGSTTMRYMAAMASRLKYGGDPVSSSTTVLPTLQISLVLNEKFINSTILFHRLSIPREANHLNNFWRHPIGGAYNLSMRSGMQYCKKPTGMLTSGEAVSAFVFCVAIPKSASLMCPSFVTRRFAPLMSR